MLSQCDLSHQHRWRNFIIIFLPQSFGFCSFYCWNAAVWFHTILQLSFYIYSIITSSLSHLFIQMIYSYTVLVTYLQFFITQEYILPNFLGVPAACYCKYPISQSHGSNLMAERKVIKWTFNEVWLLVPNGIVSVNHLKKGIWYPVRGSSVSKNIQRRWQDCSELIGKQGN